MVICCNWNDKINCSLCKLTMFCLKVRLKSNNFTLWRFFLLCLSVSTLLQHVFSWLAIQFRLIFPESFSRSRFFLCITPISLFLPFTIHLNISFTMLNSCFFFQLAFFPFCLIFRQLFLFANYFSIHFLF